MRKHQPVAGVRLQMLDDVFGDGSNNNGLALSEVNQVGSDLRAVITWGVPGNTQAGGRRVEWWRPRITILIFFIFIYVHRSLVPLQLGLLQRVDVANGCWNRAGRLAQHCLTEGPHASHIHSLHKKTQESANQVNVNSHL